MAQQLIRMARNPSQVTYSALAPTIMVCGEAQAQSARAALTSSLAVGRLILAMEQRDGLPNRAPGLDCILRRRWGPAEPAWMTSRLSGVRLPLVRGVNTLSVN